MIFFDEYGSRSKPTILLLHGAAATDMFCHQYGFQSDYHLVVPHLFGSGKEVGKVYDPDQMIEALAELVRSLGRDKIMVMGHSLGGELAVALVAKYPDFFSKAVFLSAWVCPSDRSVRLYTKIARYSCFTLKFAPLVRWQANYWHYTKEQADFMVEYSRKITPEQYAAWFSRRIRLDALPEYSSASLPILAVCGAKEVPEMKASLRELGRRNPNCRTLLLEKASHDYPLRMPGKLNPILLDFFGQ